MSLAPWVPLVSTPDLIREREGHCSAVATLRVDPCGNPSVPRCYVVCIGGYVEGSFEPDAVAARIDGRATTMLDGNSASLAAKSNNETLAADAGINDNVEWRLEWFVCGRHACCEVDGMSMCADDHRQRFLLFGGLDGSTYEPRNALVVARWSTVALGNGRGAATGGAAEGFHLVFNAIDSLGDVPEARWRHAAVMVEHQMWVFGGTTATEEQSNDLFVLDISSMMWRMIDASAIGGPVPPPRFLTAWVPVCLALDPVGASDSSSLQSANAKRFLVLFGGACFVDGNQTSLNDVWALDASAYVWQAVSVAVQQRASGGVAQRAAAGASALPRVNGHVGFDASFALGATAGAASLMFFGGKDFATGTNDIVCFGMRLGVGATGNHVVSSTAVRVPVQGREASTITSVEDEVMFVSDGTAPHWRYTASIAVLPPPAHCDLAVAADVLLIGGQCRHNDPISVYGFRATHELPAVLVSAYSQITS